MAILTAILPDGTTATTKTARAYTHVVCYKRAGKWQVATWNIGYAKAKTAKNNVEKWEQKPEQIEIRPVSTDTPQRTIYLSSLVLDTHKERKS